MVFNFELCSCILEITLEHILQVHLVALQQVNKVDYTNRWRRVAHNGLVTELLARRNIEFGVQPIA